MGTKPSGRAGERTLEAAIEWPLAADTKITEHSRYAVRRRSCGSRITWGRILQAHAWCAASGRLPPAADERNPASGQPATPGYRAQYDIPCDNPCNMVPYKPISKSEQASLDAWQDQEGKNGGGHHDMHMGKNVVVISQTTTTPRPSATAPGPTPVNPRQPGTFEGRAAPALWVRSWDFGDAVVAIMMCSRPMAAKHIGPAGYTAITTASG